MSFDTRFIQHTNAVPFTLSGGTWIVKGGAVLTLSAGSNITVNQAAVTLDGAGATFARFTTSLNNNQGSLTLKNDRDLTVSSFSNSGTLRVEDSATLLTVNGSYTQTAGSTTLIGGAQLTNSGTFLLQGGTLAGTGAINGSIVSSGSPVISPGTSAGSLTLASADLSAGTTELDMEIGGPDPGTGHDQLIVTGGLNLGSGSTLSLALIDDFIPTFGVNFTLVDVDAGSPITGSFSNVANGGRLSVAGGAYSFKVNYGAGSPFGADKVVLSDFSDTIAPVLSLPADIVMEATAPFTPVIYAVSANDAIQGAILPPALVVTPLSGSTFPVGETTVNVSATDVVGNTANDSFTVTIEDTTPPALTSVTPSATVEATGPSGRSVVFSATATDIADTSVAITFKIGVTPISSPHVFPLGVTTVVTVTATDDSLNGTSTSFAITVVDTTAPDLLNVPANMTVEATSAAGRNEVFDPAISSSDLVDGVQVPSVTALGGVVVGPNGGSFPLGATLVTVQRTDAAGNPASSSFTVTVEDTTPPAITVPVAPVLAEATGPDGATVDFSALISVLDLVDPAPALVAVPASGTLFPLGDTLITVTATDSFDNEDSANFTVRVQDTTAPDLVLPDVIAEATSFTSTNVVFNASAADIVDGDLAGSIVFDPAGLSFGFGETTVNASVTDSAGNTVTGSFTVTVEDTTHPVFNALPARDDLAAFTTSVAGIAVNFPAFSATDLPGAPAPTVVAVPASGSVFPLGTTIVTVTATDHENLPTTDTFDVIVTGQPDIGAQETGGPEIADGGSLAAFAPTELESSSSAKSLTIRNDGANTLNLGAITLGGDHPGDFSTTNPADNELAPGESTTFTVTFTPTAPGPRQAVLLLASNDPDAAESAFDISLGGTGIDEPLVVTGTASDITYAGATLNGSITANFADATVTFEYGTSTAYGQSIAATPASATGGAATPVSASLQGLLLPETTYHFRLRAENAAGTTLGADATFTTPPLAAGDLDLTFNPEINGLVFSTVVQPDGKILIGGYFTEVNGVERNRIARLNSDGTLDTAFNPPGGINDGEESGSVLSIAVQKDGKILIGGDFQTVNGEARTNLARLNSDGTRDTAWNATLGGMVNSIVIDTLDRIHVGGFFTTATTNGLRTYFQNGNILRDYLLKFDTEPASVYGLAVDNQGRLLVAGNINTIGIFPPGALPFGQGLIRITISGGVETTTFQPDILGAQQLSVRPDGKLIVTGFFTEVNGVPKERIVRLNDNGTLDGTFTPSALESSIFSLVTQVDSRTLAAGGSNTAFNSATGRFLAADGGTDPSFQAGSDIQELYSVTQQPDGSILIGGGFTSVDGIPRTNLARLINGPATETLSIDGPSRVEWLRDGNAPEVHTVIFEKSLNGGTTWTLHGLGVRIPGGWENTNSLGGAGLIRVTARTTGGWLSSSSGMIIYQTPFGAPSIGDIADQSTNEDTSIGPIAFTVGDLESPASALTVCAISSNTSLVTTGGIVFGGSNENRTINITPVPNASGTTTITVTVSDGVNTASDQFIVTVEPDNDLPTISDIANQSTNEDTPIGPIAFTVGDLESPASALTVSAISSNTSLVTTGGIVFGGSDENRTINITPVPNASGTTTITVTVSDGVNTASDQFVVTVEPDNDLPTISDIANQSTNEDTPIGPIAFTVGDLESPASALTVSATSSNTSLVTTGGIVLGGSNENRIINITPVPDASGTTPITVTVSDGVNTASDQFVVTVNPINDAPGIGPISDQFTHQGLPTTPVLFIVTDTDTPVGSLGVSATSDNPALLPTANILIQNGPSPGERSISLQPAAGQFGTATVTVAVNDGEFSANTSFLLTVNGQPTITGIANQSINEDTTTGPLSFTISDPESPAETLTVTGTSSDQSKVPNGGIVISGTGANRSVTITPQSNGFGNAQITLTVSDGVNTASTVFEVTINAVNDAPFIFEVDDQFANQGFSVGPIPVSVGDPDPGLFSSLIVSAVTDNPVLLPLENIVIVNGLFPKRITLHPASGQSGTATITLTVTDGELTDSTTFLLTVNGAPTISSITNQFMNEDTSTGPLAFTVNDPENPAENLTVTRSSSNTSLVPLGNIVLGGSGAARTVTVTPSANASGTATITLTVSEGFFFNIPTTFIVNVAAVNDAPSTDTIPNQTILEGQAAGPVQFSIADVDSNVSALAVTASSDHPTLVPPSGIVFQNVESSPGVPVPGLKMITVTPAPGKSGTTTITVTVSDGQASTDTTFLLTVAPTLEIFASPPVITPATTILGAGLSATLTGAPGAFVKLEASGDLGHTIPWQVIGQTTLNGSGQGSFSNVRDDRSMGPPAAKSWFFRLRQD